MRRLVLQIGWLIWPLALVLAACSSTGQAQQAQQIVTSATPPVASQANQQEMAAPTEAATPTPTHTPPTATPAVTATPQPTVTPTPEPVIVNGRTYDAYIPTANKEGQEYQYSCEFDAAWAILQTYGMKVTVDDIISRMPQDRSVEPRYQETPDGVVIYGGDIRSAFSGDYRENFLARSTGQAMIPLFASYGLQATPVKDRVGVEAALRQGSLVWMKTTVDFKPWRPATWIMPDGTTHRTVLGNDHAVVVSGFNSEVVVIRDVLGPTSSNWQRPYEYDVPWDTFMQVWEAQSFDGLAVAPPHLSRSNDGKQQQVVPAQRQQAR